MWTLDSHPATEVIACVNMHWFQQKSCSNITEYWYTFYLHKMFITNMLWFQQMFWTAFHMADIDSMWHIEPVHMQTFIDIPAVFKCQGLKEWWKSCGGGMYI